MYVATQLVNTQVSTERFWRLTEKELRRLYKTKVLTAVGYIEGIIRLNKAGFVLRTTVKEFCKNWGIPRRTFYNVLKKLPSDIHFECEDNAPIRLWHGGEVVQLPDVQPVAQATVQPVTNTEKLMAHGVKHDSKQQFTTEPSMAHPVQRMAHPVQRMAQSPPETLATQASCNAKDTFIDNLKDISQEKREKTFLKEEKKLPRKDESKVDGHLEEVMEENLLTNEQQKQLDNSIVDLVNKTGVPTKKELPRQKQTSPARSTIPNNETIVKAFNFCLWVQSYKKANGHEVKSGKAWAKAYLENGGEGRQEVLDLYEKWQRLTVNLDGEQTEYLGYEVPDFAGPQRDYDWHKGINDEWERLAQREVDFGRQLDFAIAKASEEISNKYRWFGHWLNFVARTYPDLKINPQPRELNNTNASQSAREKIRSQIEAARKKNKAERAANREKMARGE